MKNLINFFFPIYDLQPTGIAWLFYRSTFHVIHSIVEYSYCSINTVEAIVVLII